MGQSLVMQSQLEHLPRGTSSPDPGAGIASQKGQARVSDARKKSTSAWQALKTHQSPPNLLLPMQQFSVPGRKKLKKKRKKRVKFLVVPNTMFRIWAQHLGCRTSSSAMLWGPSSSPPFPCPCSGGFGSRLPVLSTRKPNGRMSRKL